MNGCKGTINSVQKLPKYRFQNDINTGNAVVPNLECIAAVDPLYWS